MQSQFESGIAPSRRRKPNFAEKLHAVLSNKDCRHAIAWLPSGRSFCITDQEEFVKKILPKHFREAKFESFSRRLKRWGFRKVYTTGLSQIIFSHDLFHRDRQDLCRIMNGREKVAADECTQGSISGSGGTPGLSAPVEQFHNTIMFQQPRATAQHLLQQQMVMELQMNQQHAAMLAMNQQQVQCSYGSLTSSGQSFTHNPVTMKNISFSPEDIDTSAVISKAQAIIARSMPGSNLNQQVNFEDPNSIQDAQIRLTRLNDDIANCEEQLAVLERMRALKEMRRKLGGVSSPRGVSPSST